MAEYVDLSERVTATFYDQEYEEWTQQTVTIADVLDSVCDDYTVLPSAQSEPSQVARDIATILENEKDMRVIERNDIVRCKDCKHWICHDRRCGYWNHGVKPLEWCCHGERITDGN